MLKKIVRGLINTGKKKCLVRAESLETEVLQTGCMNLRNLGLQASDITRIAKVLESEKYTGLIKTISFSYNELIGDKGASEIARSLPVSICEIGLVGCGVGDKGGLEILNEIKTLPNLKMICIEQNDFSDQLKMEFNLFKRNNPQIMVVV